jgi:AcrR family transcriptional regulator
MSPRQGSVRRYESRLRETQAAGTRRAIVDAAARLFIERGYGATSIDAIAAAAGVGRATVFTAVGGKAEVLRRAYDTALMGDDEPGPLRRHPRAVSIRAETDPTVYLGRYAELVTEIDRRQAGIHEAMRGAAATDPEVRALFATLTGERRAGSARVVGDLVAKGGLRDELDREAAADIVWVLNDPGLYHLLVTVRGWSDEQFRTWLAVTLRGQLLP